jgi:uncharacterized protein (DUF58 family)
MEINELIKTLKKVKILSNTVSSQQAAGVNLSALKGRGGLFDSVRKYEPGDDVRSINWNVTARLSETYINTYSEDKARRIWLLADISGSCALGTTGRRKIDLAMEIAATIAYSAILENDQVGALFFSDKIERLVMPVKGMAGFWQMAAVMAACAPCSGATRMEPALNFLMKMNCTGNLIFIFSDFIGTEFQQACSLLARQNEVVLIRVFDKIEEELPDIGWVRGRDIESGKEKWLNTSSRGFREIYRAHRLKYLEDYHGFLRRTGVRHMEVRTDEDLAGKWSLLSR